MNDTNLALGFIGLGEMGGRMAPHLVEAGYALAAYDAAGTEARAPEGAKICTSIADLARSCEIALLSLPDGPVVEAVCGEIAAVSDRTVSAVVDHSTIGTDSARKAHAVLADAGIAYLDAPVSGGTTGAAKGTLAMMISGDRALYERLDPALATMAKNRFLVGSEPGQGQVMKLLNNMLSGTAMTATTEAVVFGEAHGLDLKTMIDVINVATGRNTASSDKYPNRIIPGTFDAGFTIDLLSKDLDLFLAEADKAATGDKVGHAVGNTLRAMKDAMPGADFTRIYQFHKDRAG